MEQTTSLKIDFRPKDIIIAIPIAYPLFLVMCFGFQFDPFWGTLIFGIATITLLAICQYYVFQRNSAKEVNTIVKLEKNARVNLPVA